MAAYNAEATIAFAIDSVLNQTWEHWELIIVNDGSEDQTENKIVQFQDHRILYYEQKNSGVSVARNKALQHMKGNFFCFLDADDALPPESLSSRLSLFHEDPSVSFVDGCVEVKSKNMANAIGTYRPSWQGDPWPSLLALDGRSFFGPTWMIRNSGVKCWLKPGLTHGEDLLFYLELSKNGGYYTFTENVIYHYRSGNDSAMKNLRGLEEGYAQIYLALTEQFSVDDQTAQKFYKRSNLIMIKSYLANFNFGSALRLVFRLFLKKY